MTIENMTLALVQRGSEILLGMKKRGFGAGLWNGYGGKIKQNEDIYKACTRELKEEAEVAPVSIEQQGFLTFSFKDRPLKINVHVFHIPDTLGQPKETEEMRPKWFKTKDIPYDKMWPDDKYWIPLFLAGHTFRGHFIFENEKTIIGQKLDLVDKL